MNTISLAAIAVPLALSACAPPLPDSPDPRRSSVCRLEATRTDGFSRYTTGTMVMKNDGNPCWYNYRSDGRGASLELKVPPSNGTVKIVQMSERTRVEYLPKPGFRGTDTFTINNTVLNQGEVRNVTVQ